MYYPNFQQILRESLRLIVGEEVEKRVEIGAAKDGSGVGGKKKIIFDFDFLSLISFFFKKKIAALCALMALKNK